MSQQKRSFPDLEKQKTAVGKECRSPLVHPPASAVVSGIFILGNTRGIRKCLSANLRSHETSDKICFYYNIYYATGSDETVYNESP